MKIREIIKAIEDYAPRYLQESYDNCGLQVGDTNAEATAALLCVDVTEWVIDEAIERGANLVVSHHPLLFRGLKSLTGRTDIERIVIKAVKHDIAIYSAHTSMDNARGGVSWRMAQKLGLTDVKVLAPRPNPFVKVVVFVPAAEVARVEQAMFAAGAGTIGDYDSCSYRVAGEGHFRALDGANPFVGSVGESHTESEVRVEVIAEAARRDAVVAAMLQAHPYEEPAYDVIALQNADAHTGSGIVGNLPEAEDAMQFLAKLKSTFAVGAVRYCGDSTKKVKRVAMCGGSGSFLVGDAIASGADVYVTGDVKYHEFTSSADRILIADIGHFEGEQFTKEIFFEIIRKKMPNFAIYFAETEKNQINYL